MVETWKVSDLMNCLKCSNYWKTDIDETMCDKCGCGVTTTTQKESEGKNNESVRPN